MGRGRLSSAGARNAACASCFSPRGATASYLDYAYESRDILLFGRESAGVPEHVHRAAEVRLRIPMRGGLRSLNVAMTCAMAVGEAMRQTGAIFRHPVDRPDPSARSKRCIFDAAAAITRQSGKVSGTQRE